MPSPVCRIGRGLTPVCFDREVTKAERARVQKSLRAWGRWWSCRRSQLDAITAAYSSTHGYHALAALAKAAQNAGLDRETALDRGGACVERRDRVLARRAGRVWTSCWTKRRRREGSRRRRWPRWMRRVRASGEERDSGGYQAGAEEREAVRSRAAVGNLHVHCRAKDAERGPLAFSVLERSSRSASRLLLSPS